MEMAPMDLALVEFEFIKQLIQEWTRHGLLQESFSCPTKQSHHGTPRILSTMQVRSGQHITYLL